VNRNAERRELPDAPHAEYIEPCVIAEYGNVTRNYGAAIMRSTDRYDHLQNAPREGLTHFDREQHVSGRQSERSKILLLPPK
jgi:hypothetical protein